MDTIQPNVPVSKPKLAGSVDLLKQSWQIYKKRWGVLLGVLLLPILPIVGLVLLLVVFFIVGAGASFLSDYSKIGTTALVGLGIIGVILLLALTLIKIISQVALVYAVKDSQEGIGVMESYRRAWRGLVSYFWISVLASLVTLGGYMLLIVPGIIISVSISLALFVFVNEGQRGMAALRKSREYVKGYWGSVFWRFLFIALVAILLSLVPAILEELKMTNFAQIVNMVIGLFLGSLMPVYAYQLYLNIKSVRGDVVPTESKTYPVLAIIGLLGMILIPIIMILAFNKLGSLFLNSKDLKNGGYNFDTTQLQGAININSPTANDAKRKSDLYQIKAMLTIYKLTGNKYPASYSELTPKYFPVMYTDPSTKQPYKYELLTGGNGFKICAQLELGGETCMTNEE